MSTALFHFGVCDYPVLPLGKQLLCKDLQFKVGRQHLQNELFTIKKETED